MTHLSPEQISNWLIGERSSEAEGHVAHCEECREHLAVIEQGFGHFRRGMRLWAEETGASVVWKEMRPARLRLSWAWAAIPVLVFGIVLVPSDRETRRAQQEVQIAEDTLLLNQVQLRLTRSVPESMQQLMELMKEESGGLQ
jgi:hypothetical protein